MYSTWSNYLGIIATLASLYIGEALLTPQVSPLCVGCNRSERVSGFIPSNPKLLQPFQDPGNNGFSSLQAKENHVAKGVSSLLTPRMSSHLKSVVGQLRAIGSNEQHMESIGYNTKRTMWKNNNTRQSPIQSSRKLRYRLFARPLRQYTDYETEEINGNDEIVEDDEEEDEEAEDEEDEEEDDDEVSDDDMEDDEYDPMSPKGPLENNNYGDIWLPIQSRPLRNRKSLAIRRLVQEHVIRPSNFIYPLFVHGEEESTPIPSMPGVKCNSSTDILKEIQEARQYGVNTFMLFPRVDPALKSQMGEESYNPDGLMQKMLLLIKDTFPDAVLLADVALDPYTVSGHDGIIDEETNSILNDLTVYQLCKQAVSLAQAGADMVCPSDMMDGRVSALREALDMEGCIDTSILSYTCKYASSLYSPFRDAIGSKNSNRPAIDKSTYQMDYSNAREAEREALLDAEEGADMLMVKPGLPYLDILHRIHQKTQLPIAAYHVSGEYSMIKAAAAKGWIDEKRTVLETLKSFKRAGASAIATYYAKDAAKWLHEDDQLYTEPCH